MTGLPPPFPGVSSRRVPVRLTTRFRCGSPRWGGVVLVCCWSPKGGSGTSVFAAACALTLARDGRRGAPRRSRRRSAADPRARRPIPPPGCANGCRSASRRRSTRSIGWPCTAPHGLTLLPAGRADLADVPPEAGAALGCRVARAPAPTIVDVGVPSDPAPLEALLAVADANVVVVRGCYLALRRAVRMPPTAGATGAVLVEESGRALGARDVADVLGVPGARDGRRCGRRSRA